jgi:hypothetical protein
MATTNPSAQPPRAKQTPAYRPQPPTDKNNRTVFLDFNQAPEEIVRIMDEAKGQAACLHLVLKTRKPVHSSYSKSRGDRHIQIRLVRYRQSAYWHHPEKNIHNPEQATLSFPMYKPF